MLCGVVVRVGVLRDVQVALDDASRVREGRPLAPTEARNSPARRRLTGAYAVGPEAGDWLQQAALAIRASVSLDLLADMIQPFPIFSEIYLTAVQDLMADVGSERQPVGVGS